MKQRPELVLALDVENMQKARYFLNKLCPAIKIFKVGPQLFTCAGPGVVRLIRKKGAEVFLDLKFLDIPNTVASAVRQAARLKVKMLTLHISGGKEMLKAAVQASREESAVLKIKPPLLIGVTVLTSQKAHSKDVLRLAREGLACGLDGVVCSAREAALLRKEIKKSFVIVTPGIRPSGKTSDDQKRTAAVEEAIRAGSDFLVIGRPILKTRDPLSAAKEILKTAKS